MAQPILEARNLVKKYGNVIAVDDVTFSIGEGEILGLLGPNGAGKSTIISLLTGLFPPDGGAIQIVGIDAVAETEKVKQLVGVVPQDLALYPTLSGRENLRFFADMYGLNGARRDERIAAVLGMVSMTERANDRVQSYSGGMKRRINLAVGLINNPRLLFLDEPTVGVDPQSRAHIFESVERLNRDQGMSVLYTTHYMEEAERLCHRIAILDRGKIIALDTPRNLIAMLGDGIIQIGLHQADEALRQQIVALSQVRAVSDIIQPPPEEGQPGPARQVLKIEARKVNEALLQVIQLFNKLHVEILSLETLEPNLESVFLYLTGKSLRE
jgi:ABC-2 type transport system ATP-binding protein